MYDWHNENCDMKFSYQDRGVRSFWCKTHNQWAHTTAKITYVFEPHFSDKYLPKDLDYSKKIIHNPDKEYSR